MHKPNVLITPTLLNAYEFAVNAPPSWKARAMSDFVAKIRREKVDFPDWVQRGMDFEDTVYRVCNKAMAAHMKTVTVGSDNFQKIANACMGGDFQKVYKKTIEIDGQSVLFYNKLDIDFANKIKDIKTTLKWKGPQKYTKGWQHDMYLWAANKFQFVYIVAVWKNEYDAIVDDVHFVEYAIANDEQMQAVERRIVAGVKDLFNFLQKQGLYEDYYNTFSNNSRR